MGIFDDVSPALHVRARVDDLFWRARCVSNWSHWDEALLLLARAFETLASEAHPPGDILHGLHQLRGRIHLKMGDRRGATEQLAASAGIEFSFLLSISGPGMLLPDELLRAGEIDAVLDYLEACRRLWPRGEERLLAWMEVARLGRIPDFGSQRRVSLISGPDGWELRRSGAVLGRLYQKERRREWFVCTFEPAPGFEEVDDILRYDFRGSADDASDVEQAYDRLQKLGLALHPGDGGPCVTGMVLQIEGDRASFRY